MKYILLFLSLTAFADHDDEKHILKRLSELEILNDRPINAQTPVHLLDDEVTPTSRVFIRNNGYIPQMSLKQDLKGWKLVIDGEVENKLELTMEDIKTRFEQVTYQLTLECGGNGRAAFHPPAKGNQWTYGAVASPEWKGVRLADVLKKAGLEKSAVYTAYYAMDEHISGDPDKIVISRGTPIKKALEPTSILAYEMNGKPLLPEHGWPIRLVIPGYPASVSGKWLKKITIRDRVHDGAKMNGKSYRVPKFPVKPGAKVADKDMKIIEEMPVKSIITHPRSGLKTSSRKLTLRGHAWTGFKKIEKVEVTFDFGKTWQDAKVSEAKNPFAWQRWEAQVELPSKGYFEIYARATDDTGASQPMLVPGWNPKGYLNNASPRIAVEVK
jgi:DMSO/TMAO reductase YedYZ molybdopterin-dependent catalytic subunit